MKAGPFALIATAALAAVAAAQTGMVRKVAPGVYYRESDPAKRIIANTGWIVLRDYTVVIDANYPWGARAVLEDVRKTTDKPVRFVFNTHYHSDHSFGNAVFAGAGAVVICSEACGEESLRKNGPRWELESQGPGAGPMLKHERLDHPQLLFPERFTLNDGSRRVEFIRMGPAHTLGDSVVWLPQERILFTGDLFVNGPSNNVADPDADLDRWLQVLDSLARYDAAVIIPGHGPPATSKTINGQRAFLRDLIDSVRAGIQRGAGVDELVRSIDLSAHEPWGSRARTNEACIRALHSRFTGK
jgi:cyclase